MSSDTGIGSSMWKKCFMVKVAVLIFGAMLLGGTGLAGEYIIGAGDSVHVFVDRKSVV